MKATGSIFLKGVKTLSSIDLDSASIGGQLDCVGVKFEVVNGPALNVQDAQINSALSLAALKPTPQ